MDSTRAVVRELTPDPVHADRRPAGAVGRQARLELVFGVRRGRTQLTHAYAEPPFRVGHVFRDGDAVRVILVCAAPGVFGGDFLQQTIVVEEGARVALTTPSALQVHAAAEGGVARLCSAFRIAAGGQLQCEWEPIIPFAGARLQQKIAIDAADSAHVLWSDAQMSGRSATGEHWRFDAVSHELSFVRGGALEYLERYEVTPADCDPVARWCASEAEWFGTVLASGSPVPAEAIERIHRELSAWPGVNAAADALGPTLALIRLTATSPTAFREARKRAAAEWQRSAT
jgi:urease accessory protein UreH